MYGKHTSPTDPMGTLLEVDTLVLGNRALNLLSLPMVPKVHGFLPLLIPLMEEILHHLGCIKACKIQYLYTMSTG